MLSVKNKITNLLVVMAMIISAGTTVAPALATAPSTAAAPAERSSSRISASIEQSGLTAIAVSAPNGVGKDLWQRVAGTPPPGRAGAKPEIKPRHFGGYKLNRGGMAALLATAPNEHSQAARKNPLVLSLPKPDGTFESFAIQESPIMEPGLAAKHPEIKTFSGRGIDDPAATIRFDLTPLGFHASVRSPAGGWYIDPYYQLDDSLYASYFGRDLSEDPHGIYVERDADAAELSVDHAYYHAADIVLVHGSGFATNAEITMTISDPEEH